MNVEDIRTFCLSLGEVEERFPFGKFRAARDVLAFYVCGHMFCYFDINDISCINIKAEKDDIMTLRQNDFIGEPYNGNAKYWIGVDAVACRDSMLRQLIDNSYSIVRAKYSRHDYEFDAVIEPVPERGGAFVRFPIDIKKTLGRGRLKVHAAFDGIPYDGSIVNMGIRNDDSSVCYILGMLKDIRLRLGKQIGDRVHVCVDVKEESKANIKNGER